MAENTTDQAAREREEALKAQQEADAETDRRMRADEFVVTAPYVTLKVKDATGTFVIRGYNEGAVVNKDDLEEANLRHHVETGLMAPKDSPEAQLAGPAGTPKPGEPPNVPVTEQPAQALPFDERQRRQQAAQAEAQQQDKRTSRSRASDKPDS